MASILFISDRNILNPTGERTLIMDRASTLFSEFGVTTRILLVRPGKVAAHAGRDIPLPEGVTIESSIYQTPLQLRAQMRNALKIANEVKPTQIVFSGLIVPNWVGQFSKAGHSVCVDVHGDVDEWVEYPPKILGQRAIGRMLGPIAKWFATRSVKNADASYVVSKRTESWVKSLGVEDVFRIPCCTTEIPSQDEWMRNRNHYRDVLGIESSATVWMYSGGTSGWQMIAQTVQLALRISKADPNSVFVFATSAGEALFQQLELGPVPPQFRLVKFPADEVVAALCAADAGFMLRNNSHTNNAAFPNKFSEYLAAGLFVVTGEGLTDPAAMVRAHSTGMVLTENQVQNPFDEIARELVRSQMANADDIWGHTRKALEEIRMANTLVEYVDHLQSKSLARRGSTE